MPAPGVRARCVLASPATGERACELQSRPPSGHLRLLHMHMHLRHLALPLVRIMWTSRKRDPGVVSRSPAARRLVAVVRAAGSSPLSARQASRDRERTHHKKTSDSDSSPGRARRRRRAAPRCAGKGLVEIEAGRAGRPGPVRIRNADERRALCVCVCLTPRARARTHTRRSCRVSVLHAAAAPHRLS